MPIICLAVVTAAFLWAILDPLLEPHLVMVGKTYAVFYSTAAEEASVEGMGNNLCTFSQ